MLLIYLKKCTADEPPIPLPITAILVAINSSVGASEFDGSSAFGTSDSAFNLYLHIKKPVVPAAAATTNLFKYIITDSN